MSCIARAWLTCLIATGIAGSSNLLLLPDAWAQFDTLPQSALLQPPAGDRDAGDAFGSAIAASGVRVVVGAPGDDERGLDAGAAYVFVRRDGAWTFETKLAPALLEPGDGFGSAVAIHGDRIVVGAPRDDRATDSAGAVVARHSDRGAAYLFTRSGTGWQQTSRLEPFTGSDGHPPDADDHFGSCVAVSDVVVVTAPESDVILPVYGLQGEAGAAYTFHSNGSADRYTVPYQPHVSTGDSHLGRVCQSTGTATTRRLRLTSRDGLLEYVPDGTTWALSAHLGTAAPGTAVEGLGIRVGLEWPGALINTPDGIIHSRSGLTRSISSSGLVRVVDRPTNPGGEPVWAGGRVAFSHVEDQVYSVAIDGTPTFLAGDRTKGYTDGVGIDVGFGGITGAATDGAGGMFVADACTIRHVSADGTVVRVAGLQTVCTTADGVGASARLLAPSQLQWDAPRSTLVFVDGHAIRAMRPGFQVVTLAGSTTEAGALDGTGTAARFTSPRALAVAPDGSIAVGTLSGLRRIDASRVVTTPFTVDPTWPLVDGTHSEARFGSWYYNSIAFDDSGLLFILDGDQYIRTVTPSNVVTTIVGLPPAGGETTDATVGGFAFDDDLFVVGRPGIRPPAAPADHQAGVAWVFDPVNRALGLSGYPLYHRPWGDAVAGFGMQVATRDGIVFVSNVDASHAGPGQPIAGYERDRDGAWLQGLSLAPPSLGMGVDYGAALATSADELFVGSPTSLATPGGFVAVFDVAARDADRDGLPDRWERTFGLDPASTTGSDGADGDPDGDGVTNAGEFTAQTHPTGVPAHSRYFAEGATTWQFDTTIHLTNPGTSPAAVLLRFMRADGKVLTHAVTVGASAHDAVRLNDIADMDDAEFSTMIESDASIAADRVVSWPRDAADGPYGSHAERAVVAPSSTWYFAEGATHSGFNLFYLLQNPSDSDVTVRATFLTPAGSPLAKSYVLPPRSRSNIWVDTETFAVAGGTDTLLADTDVGAVFEVTAGADIVVERAQYLEGPGRRTFEAGHESAGVTTPATSWFLPEGATGDFFDTFILVANPTGSDALVRVTFLLADGRTFARDLSVSARARTNIWADLESFDGGVTFPLADAAFSTTLVSLTGVPIVVERSMWWPGPTFASWREAHNSFGSSQAGTLWAGFGDVAANGPGDTYFLVANASATAATVAVTLAKTSGAVATKTFTVAPHSRFNVSVASEFPALVGAGSFGAVVESLGTVPTEIVVERATYTSEPGLVWSAGTGSLLTRIR